MRVRWILASGALILGGLAGWVWSSVSQSPYIGPSACFKCHIDLARRWAESPHSKYLLLEGLPAERHGCEACHGPGRAHASSRQTRKQIVAWRALSREAADAICLKCHMPKVTAQEWQSSPHNRQELPCTACHEVHRKTSFPTLLRTSENSLCLGCHRKIAIASPEEHHPVPPNLVCSKCHNPHTKGSGLLVKPKEELCQDCHGKGGIQPPSHKQAPWPDNHGKLALADMKGCLTCHNEPRDCRSCHGVTMPHPEDYVTSGHMKEASFDPKSACFKCHRTNFCNVCHIREGEGQE